MDFTLLQTFGLPFWLLCFQQQYLKNQSVRLRVWLLT